MKPSTLLSRGVIGLAVLVYLAIALGCMFTAGESATTAPVANGGGSSARLSGLPFRGVAMQIQRTDWLDRYKKSLDEIAELGADTFLCIVDARQENGGSGKIYLDLRMTPDNRMLGEIIEHAQGRKLRVVLMPIVLLDAPRGDEWRGKIKPPSWVDWFDSYRDMLRHFSYVAEEKKVDMFVVGSELVSTEEWADEWRRTIAEVRKIYKGALTYSSNWDHYHNIPFWDQLDVIGMNSYWKLGEDRNVKIPEIVGNWRNIQKEVLGFCQKKGKPLFFTEVGWCSLANAADEPWDYTKTSEPQDLDLQKRLWEGFFQAWHGHQQLAGFTIWAWSPNDGGPEADKDYSIKGKPAYQLVKQWLAKPWGQKTP